MTALFNEGTLLQLNRPPNEINKRQIDLSADWCGSSFAICLL